MKLDTARRRTDRILNGIESEIGEIYAKNKALKKIGNKYRDYMDFVDNSTILLYNAFQAADDKIIKQELKAAYMRKIAALTTQSKAYQDIIREFAFCLAEVNQLALDAVNAKLPEIYMINYNQVAEECEKAGIQVNG